jgi:hypothetical protein
MNVLLEKLKAKMKMGTKIKLELEEHQEETKGCQQLKKLK